MGIATTDWELFVQMSHYRCFAEAHQGVILRRIVYTPDAFLRTSRFIAKSMIILAC